MPTERVPWDESAYGGAFEITDSTASLIKDPARPDLPGYKWATETSLGAWGQTAYGGGSIVSRPTSGGVTAEADPTTASARLSMWWTNASYLRVVRVVDGQRQPVRGADPIQVITATRTNLCTNPSLEVDLTGWLSGLNTTLTRRVGIVAPDDAGTCCARLKANTSGAVNVTLPVQLPTTTQFWVSMSLNMSNAPTGALTLTATWQDVNAAALTPSTTSIPAAELAEFVNRWDRTRTLTLTPAPGAVVGALAVQIGGLPANAVVDVDTVLVETQAIEYVGAPGPGPGPSPGPATGEDSIWRTVFEEIAYEMTSTTENSTTNWTAVYPYIQDINDERGYTAGLVGFTSATDDLRMAVQRYTVLRPTGNQLAPYLDELQTLSNEDMSPTAGPRADQLLGLGFRSLWGGTPPDKTQAADLIRARIYSGSAINTNWTWTGAPALVTTHAAALKAEYLVDVPGGTPTGDEASDWLIGYVAAHPGNGGLNATDALLRQAQRDLKEEMYWRPAFNQAIADGVGPLGLAILYDILVNHGPGTDPLSFGGIVTAARAQALPPSLGGNETAYLTALIDKRSAALSSPEMNDNPIDGRVNMHRNLLATGNLLLRPPFSWTVYGDTFTLTTRPDLPAEAARPGGVQPGAEPPPPPPPPPDPEEPPTELPADSIYWTTHEEVAYEFTSTAENSRKDWYALTPHPIDGSPAPYAYIEAGAGIGDNRGYTAGIVGWTTANGDMLELIQHYVQIKPTGNQMQPYLDELQTLANEGESTNASNRANQLLGAPFRNLWASLALSPTDSLFRKAQRDERDRMYWRPAFNQAVDDEIGPLGLLILYDISVNHGVGDDRESFGGIVADAQDRNAPPSQGGNEAAYLDALIDFREVILAEWGDNQADGRVPALRSLLASGNLLLHVPFSWSMYGVSYSITTRPDLPTEAARPGGVQPGTPTPPPEEPPPEEPPPLSADSIWRTTFEEMAYEITSTAENDKKQWYANDIYGYIEPIGDGRGYTAGIVGFCSGTGDMLQMIDRYIALKPANNQMSQYRSKLVTLANEGMGPNAETRANALLGNPFKTLWSNLGTSDTLFRQAQREMRESLYWRWAFNQAIADGLRGFGLHVLYDISINHGPHTDRAANLYWTSREGIVADAQDQALPPTRGGSEDAYIEALIDMREQVLIEWDDNPANGRVNCHRDMLADNNPNLHTPFSWSMYGTTHNMNTRPELPAEARRPGDVQPGAPPSEEEPPAPPPSPPPPEGTLSPDSIYRTIFEEMAYEITSTAENSRTDWYAMTPGPDGKPAPFRYCEDIDDDRGYTAGIVGFCSGTGDMLEMIDRYIALKPASNAMQPYRDELVTLANEGMSSNAGNRADALLGAPFIALWSNLGLNDPLFRKAQMDQREEMYFRPAFNQAVADGVGPLGLEILYDISVNHGPGNDSESFGGIVQAARNSKNPPSQGGGETAYLNALIDKRSAVLTSWGDNPANGRVAAHRSLVNSGNMVLNTPVSWSMYSDPFTIPSPRPELPVEYRRPGNVQPGAPTEPEPPPPDPEEPPPPPPPDTSLPTNSIYRTTFEEISYEFVSTAENSRLDWHALTNHPDTGDPPAYAYIEAGAGIGDNRGYTAGICGWTTANGDMLELIDHYIAIKPTNNQMAQYRSKLVTLANEGESGQASNRANSLLGAPFRNLWASLALSTTDPLFRQAQRDERERLYWSQAWEQAVDDEVGPLGLLILYDISINHGEGIDPESFGGIVSDAQDRNPPPSQGGNQAAYLDALIDFREAVLEEWGDNQADGRVPALRSLLASNLNLVAPITWSMYGEPYTINPRPELPPEAARPGNVQPGAPT